MNIGNIVTSGPKGQIVIPAKIREELHIGPDTSLQITISGNSIIIHPITGIIRSVDAENSYEQILKATQGSWANEPVEDETKRHRIEKLATARNKKAW
jgi:AbrB family looped-hinge helix DNA binding protein